MKIQSSDEERVCFAIFVFLGGKAKLRLESRENKYFPPKKRKCLGLASNTRDYFIPLGSKSGKASVKGCSHQKKIEIFERGILLRMRRQKITVRWFTPKENENN